MTNWERLLKIWQYILLQIWLICPESIPAAQKRHLWRSKSKMAERNCLKHLPTKIIIFSYCQPRFFFQRIKRKDIPALPEKCCKFMLNIAGLLAVRSRFLSMYLMNRLHSSHDIYAVFMLSRAKRFRMDILRQSIVAWRL